MSESDQGVPPQPAELGLTYPPVKASDLNGVLFSAGVSSDCNLCNSKNRWFYLRTRSNDEYLVETYLYSGSYHNPYPTLSYYSRTCFNCGNMQNFSTTMIHARIEDMKSSGEADG